MCLPKSLTCITSDGEVETLKKCNTCERVMLEEEFGFDADYKCWGCRAAEYWEEQDRLLIKEYGLWD